jgi:hypothetical protein
MMQTSAQLLMNMGDHEQVGRLFTLALSCANIGVDLLYQVLVERLITDPVFEEQFCGNLRGQGLVMVGRSMEHGVALAQAEDMKSLFTYTDERREFSDGRQRGLKHKIFTYVRLASAIAVCAAAFPKNAENGERDLVTFTVEDVINLIKKAASEAKLPDEDEPSHRLEPEVILALFIQELPTDDRNSGSLDSLRASIQKTVDKFVEFNLLIERPANADGVVDYSATWRLTKLVEHFGDKALVARLREAA